MMSKFLKTVICLIIAFVLLIGGGSVSAEQGTKNADEAQSFLDDIISYNLKETKSEDLQQWINGYMAKNAGITEWYALALCQYADYDFTVYKTALVKYLSENKINSASSRQKYAIVLAGMGSGDKFIYNTLNDSIGKQGLMSWVYGLNLLNNGYQCKDYSLNAVKDKLLSLQHQDGGFSITGKYGDVDATAMVIQALSPYYKLDSKVMDAVDKALLFLSKQQKETGDFASYGVNNPESTAQVLTALSALGIDCKKDSRFIKNGNTIFDGIGIYKLSDGSFCHKTGGESNGNATIQVFYSMVSYIRMQNGKSGLYMLDNANPSVLETPQTSVVTPPSDSMVSSKPTADNKTQGSQIQDNTVTESENHSDNSNIQQTPNEESVAGINSQPQTANTTENLKNKQSENNKISYKIWVICAVIAIALAVCAVMFFKGNKNIKNYILVIVASASAVLIVLVTNIQTVDDYYKNKENTGGESVGTVTVTIRCDTIKDRSAKHIPDDGIILDVTEINFKKDSTVYDVLLEATASNKIHLETTGTAKSVYVQGINNIYEFDFGELSGWGYYVNGVSPSVGCGEYKVKDGDKIEWLYTCNLGKDIE